MNKSIDSYYKMSTSTLSFLQANTIVTATIPGFSTIVLTIQNGCVQIVSFTSQVENKKYDSLTKKTLKLQLATQTIDIIRKLAGYAVNTNNTVLLNQVKYNESNLKRMKDTNLLGIAQNIHSLATANLSALAAYGITTAILTTLQTITTNFTAAIPKIRLNTIDKKALTLQLTTILNTLKTNFNKLDVLVEMVRISQPNFYEEYKAVRKIIKTTTSKICLRINVNDLENSEVIAKADVTIKKASNEKIKLNSLVSIDEITKKSTAKGTVQHKNLEEGEYIITIKKAGYNNKTVSCFITNNELTKIQVNLEKVKTLF